MAGQGSAGLKRFLVPSLVVGLVLIALAAYWAQLLATYDWQREQKRQETVRLASQTAQALSLQYGTFFRELDAFSKELALEWQTHDYNAFDQSLLLIRDALPEGVLLQVSIIDSMGVPEYARATQESVAFTDLAAVNVVDREYFKIHEQAQESVFHIGAPLFGRLTNIWVVPVTRGLWKDGAFAGVLILAISSEHLAAALKAIFPDQADVGILLRADGAYLSRSSGGHDVVGTWLPSNHPFIWEPTIRQGDYTAKPSVDDTKRFYAWWRGENYPFVVNVGYSRDKALAAVESSIARSLVQNLIASVLLALVAMTFAWIWVYRNRQTQRLRDVSQRLTHALEAGRLGAWEWWNESGLLQFDATCAQICGYETPRGVNATEDWTGLLHPDDAARVMSRLEQSISDPTQLYRAEYRIVRKDGTTVWVSDYGQVVECNDSGQAVRMVGTKQDVSQRKLVQLTQEALREQLTKLVEQVPGMVYQYQQYPDGRSWFPFVSPGVADVYDVTPSELMISAQKVFDVLAPQDLARVRAEILLSAQTLEEWRSEYRVIGPDGKVRWISGQARPEKLEDGSVLWHGYIHDVTSDHVVAQALKASEAHLRLTLQAVQDGLWSFDHNTGFVQWDEAIRDMLGYRGAEWEKLSVKQIASLVYPADWERMNRQVADVLGRHYRDVIWLDFRIKTADDRWLWVQARGRVVEWSEDARPTRTIGILSDISEYVTHRQLREALLDRSPTAIVLVDRHLTVLDANASFRALFLQPGESLSAFSLGRMFSDDRVSGSEADLMRGLEHIATHQEFRKDYSLIDVNGTVHWFDIHGALLDPDDADGPVLWTLVDICARHQAQTQLQVQSLRLTTLLERFPNGVLIEDDAQKVVFVNDLWCDLMGVNVDPRALVGVDHEGLSDLIGSDHHKWLENVRMIRENTSHSSVEIREQGGIHYEIEYQQIHQGDDHLGSVWFVRDVTDRKQQEQRLTHLASTDPLTQLPNRRSFMQEFERDVDQYYSHPDEQSSGVLLMLDIDHFKRVNDTYGHGGGDKVLRTLGKVILSQIRQGDYAGRIGGEEFAIILPNVSLERGQMVAQRIRVAVGRAQTDINGVCVTVTISIGVAVFDKVAPSVLMERADSALYQAKRSGRNRVCVWKPDVWTVARVS